MQAENKTCQNCKNNFVIEAEDFDFYKKIDVPAPTFCPECRMQRRMASRNERTLYKRKCDMTGKDMITIFAPDKPLTVYFHKEWWGDGWDPHEYGMDYDPNRSFWEQYRELQMKTPWMNLVVGSDLVNCDYINHASTCKDCYLIFNADGNENVLYSENLVHVKDSMDCSSAGQTELAYQSIDVVGSKIFYSENCKECTETYFSKNCVGCSSIFGCMNLRNKSYCVFNEQLTKEEYDKRIKEYDLDKHSSIEKFKKEAYAFWLKHPHRYYHGRKNVDCEGEYVYESKNCKNVYECSFAEDCKHCQFLNMANSKDCYDITEWGEGIELCYESITCGEQSAGVKFCYATWAGAQDTEYCMMSPGARNCFGCCNMKKGEYCILNKKYSKEEYHKLREQIIKDMNENPYVDAQGRVWQYGEFFPYDVSMFGYNESWAQAYFPLNKETALARGYQWFEDEKSGHTPTIMTSDLPESINDVNDGVLQEIIECSDCKKAYRIVVAELGLLRRFGLPLPRKCSSCRYMERLSRINPPKLWKRKTADGEEVMTAYAPDRPEIILSEKGYQDEVM